MEWNYRKWSNRKRLIGLLIIFILSIFFFASRGHAEETMRSLPLEPILYFLCSFFLGLEPGSQNSAHHRETEELVAHVNQINAKRLVRPDNARKVGRCYKSEPSTNA